MAGGVQHAEGLPTTPGAERCRPPSTRQVWTCLTTNGLPLVGVAARPAPRVQKQSPARRTVGDSSRPVGDRRGIRGRGTGRHSCIHAPPGTSTAASYAALTPGPDLRVPEAEVTNRRAQRRWRSCLARTSSRRPGGIAQRRAHATRRRSPTACHAAPSRARAGFARSTGLAQHAKGDTGPDPI